METFPLLCPTLVRSVAVHSMNTFFVFRVIFEWSPKKKERNLRTKVCVGKRHVLPTIDDRRHGENDTVSVIDDRVNRLVFNNMKKVLQVIVCLLVIRTAAF